MEPGGLERSEPDGAAAPHKGSGNGNGKGEGPFGLSTMSE